MDLSFLMESTSVWVIMIIAALTVLWVYVTMAAKQEQPNLTVLYEPVAPKTTTGRKNNKTKGKKQSDASPRAVPKLRETPPDPTPSKATPSARSASSKKKSPLVAEGVTKPIQDVRSKNKGRKGQNVPISKEEVVDMPEGNEGEWQTQLSRQQMRALRQKKQQQTQETGSSTPSKPITVDNSGSEEHAEENKSGGPAASEKTSYTKGGRRGKAKKQRDKDSGKSQEPPANKTVGKTADSEVDQGVPDISEAGDQARVEQRVTPSSRASEPQQELSEVEKALREAAESFPSADVHMDKSSEVDPKKQNKTRRKEDIEKEQSTSPEFSTKDHEDDWVEVIKT